MNRVLTLIVFALWSYIGINAQGTVTIKQSSEIDALVNGNKKSKTKAEIKAEKKAEKQLEKEQKERQKTQNQQVKIQVPITKLEPKVEAIPQNKVEPKIEIAPPTTHSSENTNTPTRTKWVKKRVRKKYSDQDETTTKRTVKKKALVGIKKARGFRVLAYSGGNNRASRQEAEKIGQKVKTIYPDEQVYVHFYSPRWMCQVGNYVNYKDAQRVMKKLKQEGITQANIIRTMVTLKSTHFIDPTFNFDEDY